MTESNRDDGEFVELVIRCLDGLAGPEELKALEEHLRSDRHKVQLYNDLCLQVQTLEDGADAHSIDSGDVDKLSAAGNLDGRGGPLSTRRVQGWAVAATLAIGILAGVSLAWFRPRPDVAQRPAPTTSDEFIATLIDVGDDVVWSKDHDLPRRPGQGLMKGWMRLNAGTIEMAFRSGATVRLEGPAMFGIDSCLRGSLEFGNIEVHAPERASDFTVNTPAMDVVDLGTRFSMSVDEDSGRTDVSVLKGRVDLHLGNAGRNTGIYPLTEGQSASVSTAGELFDMRGIESDADAQPAGLLAHWSFNEVDGPLADGDLIEDTSPNGLDGRVLRYPGSPDNEIRAFPAIDGNALDLSRHGVVDVGEHLDTLGELSSFTIAAWVRNPVNMIFSISDATFGRRIQFERSHNLLYYGWQNGPQWDAVRAVVDSGWAQDQWYHVAVTVDDRNVTLYRDGRVLIGPRSRGVLLGTPVQRPMDLAVKNRAFIGKVDLTSGTPPLEQFYDGDLDDLQIYGRALDADAIRYLHTHPGQACPATTHLP